jgi:hypothetical protein
MRSRRGRPARKAATPARDARADVAHDRRLHATRRARRPRFRYYFTRDAGADARIGMHSVAFAHVTPSDYACEELDLWEQALHEQRTAERELDAARVAWHSGEFFALVRDVDVLRERSDLLLAEAVRVKLLFRDGITSYGQLAGPDTDFDCDVLLSHA